ncbi:hypothetical protein C2845_PM06G14760 [Panicum miliaceum]|uniref:Uncharacterized protein n=1 Tax=Panicum miliaceum TaxID=4540 RepID=A0A3L6R8Z2_PANMI|nr:hypothetical protein C2845_PM06G14760 [Panicum miliaceum]
MPGREGRGSCRVRCAVRHGTDASCGARWRSLPGSPHACTTDWSSPALLAALDGVGCGDEGGNSTAPWEQSPCFSEQLSGACRHSVQQSQGNGEHGGRML